MCFTVLLATDSPTGLPPHNGQGVLFRPAEPDEARAANLPYPYVYGRKGRLRLLLRLLRRPL